MNATPILADRDIRQRQIIPPEKLAATAALVIGVGAIGRQAAVQLAAVGVPMLVLIDDDTVGVENLAPQAYWPEDLGRPKVQATADLCRRIYPQIRIDTHPEPFRRSSAKSLRALHTPGVRPVVLACVDSIETRRLIWQAVRERAGLFVDGRMSAEVIRVLAADRPASDTHYPQTS